ncbi:MAG TPA: NADH-ubiquinone oxidoreductase-F iron-sulfur binding region domain-containing protein [Candidatus Dormibacteraeota bacterium]|nr:NADH-ubiquinone oxidoreductase-F iron-sulfur binding region domain-containing protein [Candidatus Dormibacteraeota bacterium]
MARAFAVDVSLEVPLLVVPRLLAGPPLDGRAERLHDHLARLGPLPAARDSRDLIQVLEASGLLGRGGAGYPVGRKWRAVAEREHGSAVVVANGAEGEPASAKDRVLMAHRPHLVVDGALLAARAVGAEELVFYVGSEHEAAVESMRRAIEQRRDELPGRTRLVRAPVGYVAGEASAAVHYIEASDPRPTTTPPRMSERGLRGRSTLVQNVESLACVALVARFGDAWYREAGRAGTPGTALVTMSGDVRSPGVREIELGSTVGEVVESAGGTTRDVGAVVLGGYFGTWARAEDVWELPLDPAAMRSQGLTFGCGMVGLLPADACGVAATSRILSFMAGESAQQCGPCMYGLRALADAMARLAAGRPREGDIADLRRWSALVTGRGACRHPDGTAQLTASAMAVFESDIDHHVRTGRCLATGVRLAA